MGVYQTIIRVKIKSVGKMSSASQIIKMLYHERFFQEKKGLIEVRNELRKRGFNFSDSLTINSLSRASFLSKVNRTRVKKYVQREPPHIEVSEKHLSDINCVFSEVIKNKLGSKFDESIRELNISIKNNCGNSTAFLMRKILERAIFYAFAKNGKTDKLTEASGKLLRLEAMINVAQKEKVNGIPFLLTKTAEKIIGIKFLGDSSAHNYLMDVELIEIEHQIPFWTTAIKELIDKF